MNSTTPLPFLVACFLLFLPGSVARAQYVEKTSVTHVLPQESDCINTFTVRVMVTASNTGAAWGDYAGSRLVIVRMGPDPQHCWLDFGQWSTEGRLEIRKSLSCLFVDPLKDGGH